MTGERLGGLDMWRAGLPLIGVVYHAFVMASISGGPLIFWSFSTATHAFRMEAFFALAGLLAGVRLMRKGYGVGRLRTLLVPLAAIYLLRLLSNGGRMHELNGGSTLHLWFLVTLTVVTITAIVAERAGIISVMTRRWRLCVVLLVVWALIARAVGMADSGWVFTAEGAIGPLAVYYMPFFLAGVVVVRSEHARLSALDHRRAWIVGCLGSIFLVLRSIIDGNMAFQETPLGGLLQTTIAIFWTIGVLGTGVDRRIDAAGPVSRWLGEASFTIYLLHYPAILAAYKITEGIHWAPRLATALVIAAVLPLSIHAVAQRIPILRFVLNGAPLATGNWLWTRRAVT